MPVPTNRRYLSITEACEITGLSRNTINRRIADGTLKALRMGRNIRITREAIKAAFTPIENGG